MLVSWGSLESSGTSKFPGVLHKIQGSGQDSQEAYDSREGGKKKETMRWEGDQNTHRWDLGD